QPAYHPDFARRALSRHVPAQTGARERLAGQRECGAADRKRHAGRIAELPASEPYPNFCVRRRLLQTLLFPCAEDRRHRRRDGEKPRELAAAVARRPRIFPLPARAPRARALRPAGVVLDSSCAGRSASQTRANALMTRASIFFRKTFFARWMDCRV